MRRDTMAWAKVCLDCQQCKRNRHVKNKVAKFKAPESRFDHIYMDIVGSLPESQGYKYIVTVIDRFSRWPEAYPFADITADSVAKVFYQNWFCPFGTPLYVTTDQGSQFESALYLVVLNLLGCTRIRKTAYYPAANGMIERVHGKK